MSTPHNQAKLGEIAKTVLLPGDPLRAKFIADTFLKDVKQFNTVRNMYGYTGTYNGKLVSVMGSGMGMPSLGIYVNELYKFYGVEKVIRVGSTGSYSPDCKLFDVIIAQGACTDLKAYQTANKMNVPAHVGNVFSSDLFYSASPDEWKKWADMGCLCVEMETYALYCLASYYKKQALTILTVSDSFITKQETTPEERQTGFINMMKIALELI